MPATSQCQFLFFFIVAREGARSFHHSRPVTFDILKSVMGANGTGFRGLRRPLSLQWGRVRDACLFGCGSL